MTFNLLLLFLIVYSILILLMLLQLLPHLIHQKEDEVLERERHKDGVKVISGSVCKVRTQDTDNFDEEVKSLVSAWRLDTRLNSLQE